MEPSILRGFNLSHPPPGDEVVISGLAGKYPDSDNVHEFMENLFNKYDMVNDDTRRWKHTREEIPRRSGKLNYLNKFDAGFFDESYLEAECTDPLIRELLVKMTEAIMDAGINPLELRGTNTGIFIGSTYLETEKKWLIYSLQRHGFGLTGVSRGWMAHRLAYALGLNGPLISADTACSSSSTALTLAYESIRMGKCEAALVLGCNSLLNPVISLQFARLGVLSQDGICKVFDERADGYARSEAVVAVLLQKSKHAKRVYCRLIHAKLNCDGYKEEGITFPSSTIQRELLQQLYKECAIDPTLINFVEAHGTGTSVGDPAEAKALVDVFCQGRSSLPIGSVKSNIGHSEGASGLCSVTKAIIAMETGIIAPNIHFDIPKKSIPGLTKGLLQVVNEKQLLDGGLVAINSFGFGGANCHLLLEWNKKIKKETTCNDNLPTLVCISGRTEEALSVIFKDLTSRPVDREYINLYHAIHNRSIPGHRFRGYIVFNNESSNIIHSRYYLGQPKQSGIIFSGLDKKWTKSRRELNAIPLFKQYLEKLTQSIKILSKDLLNIFETDVEINTIFELFFSCVAVQMVFVDLFKLLNITFNYYIGNSFGQIVAAYADEIISAEEAILITYKIATSLKHDKLKSDIDVNDFNSLIKNEDLDILWEICRNKLIERNRKTTSKWLNLGESKSNTEYFVNIFEKLPESTFILNLSSEEFYKMIPPSIEIFVYVNSDKYLNNFFELLGRLFEVGADPTIDLLYPAIEYPVSRGTPMISPLIRWDHQDNWPVHVYNPDERIIEGEYEYEIDICLKKHAFYTGHVIDQRNLFPATGYLFIVWDCFRKKVNLDVFNFPITFEEVRFLRATHLSNSIVRFSIAIDMTSGIFSIVENQSLVITGKISKDGREFMKFPSKEIAKDDIVMQKDDIYKELRLRGYNYSGIFKGLSKVYPEIGVGEIEWNNNWPAFMDNLMQILILSEKSRALYVPITVEQITIDPRKHSQMAANSLMEVRYSKEMGIIQSGGVELRGLHVSDIQRRKTLAVPVLEKYIFTPYEIETKCHDWKIILRMIIHIILENINGYKFNVIELIKNEGNETFNGEPESFNEGIANIIGDLPLYQSEIESIEEPLNSFYFETNPHLIIGSNLLSTYKSFFNDFPKDCYIVSKEIAFDLEDVPSCCIFQAKYKINDNQYLILMKNSTINSNQNHELIFTKSNSFDWIEEAKNKIEIALRLKNPLLFVSQNEEFSGLLGYFNCLVREYPTIDMQCFIIEDKLAPKFDPSLEFYERQIKKDRRINVYKGEWGSYRHLLLEKNNSKLVPSAFVDITVRGDLSSLKWIEDNIDSKNWTPEKDCELVQTHYAALNFRDIMTASGKLSAEVISKSLLSSSIQGLEFSGKTLEGRRVFGIVNKAGMATYVAADKALLWEVPKGWSLEEAATVPIVYGTCLYALVVIGRMTPGETILIHAGTGGIGQAAINLALHAGCRVLATCAPHKKKVLLEKFPELDERDIGNSRDCSFYEMVMDRTDGRGVDLVLNSLAEEKLRFGLLCLAVGGRFLEIGKYDLSNNARLDLRDLSAGRSFHGIMLDKMFDADIEVKLELRNLLLQYINSGAIKPIMRTIFDMSEQTAAFKLMASGKHLGKVLLKIRPECAKVEPLLVKSIPRFLPNSNKCYIIIGGLGGFGLELARWLVCRGAKELILNSRFGIKNGYQQAQINLWKKELKVKVTISTHDILTESGVENILQMTDLPIGGIFNLAVNLQDGIFENQTKESFEASCAPKALATRILDKKSRILCQELELFVVFSSVSCGRGNTGQTNYGMANSVMERVIEKRRKDGLHGLAIQWGAIGDVGLVAKLQENNEELVIAGTLIQNLKSCLECMDVFLNQSDPIVASMVVAVKNTNMFGASNPIEFVSNILGIQDIKKISMTSSFAELGMDSMMGVEIKQGLEREFQLFLTPKDLRNMTFAKLLEINKEEGIFVVEERENFADLLNTIPKDDELDHLLEPILHFNKNKSGNPVFVIPGIESSYKIIENLIQNIKAPVNFLQLTCYTSRTYQELSNELASLIIKTVNQSEPILLIGYSVGAAIAVELAIKLEKEGFFCNLVLIDGSPLVSNIISRSLREVTLKYLKDAEVSHNLDEMSINEITFLIQTFHVTSETFKVDNLYTNLLKSQGWNERLDAFFNYTQSDSWAFKLRKEYLNSAYSRFLGAYFYEKVSEAKAIESKCHFIRTQQPLIKDTGDDYGLGIYFKNPIKISTEETDHKSIVNSEETISIVNTFFSIE